MVGPVEFLVFAVVPLLSANSTSGIQDRRARRQIEVELFAVTVLAIFGGAFFFFVGAAQVIATGTSADWPPGWSILSWAAVIAAACFALPLYRRPRWTLIYSASAVAMGFVTILQQIRADDLGLLSQWYAAELVALWVLVSLEMLARKAGDTPSGFTS